jgi:hypothetical protein
MPTKNGMARDYPEQPSIEREAVLESLSVALAKRHSVR